MNEPREPAPGDLGPTAAAQTLLGWIVGAQHPGGHQITVDDTYIHKDGQDPGDGGKGGIYMEISLQEIPYTHHAPSGAGVFLPEAIKPIAGAAFRVRQMKTILL